MLVHGYCTSMGVTVTRRQRGRDRVDYLAPNVDYVWENYVSGQPEFRNALIEPDDAHKWVKDQCANGSLIIGEYFLYIDAFELLHFPSSELVNVKNVISLALRTKFFKKIIVNLWSKSGDANYHVEFTCVPYTLFYKHFKGLLHLPRDSGIEVCFNKNSMPCNYVDSNGLTQWCSWTIPKYIREDLTEAEAERRSGCIF